jgi:hypothetical protein
MECRIREAAPRLVAYSFTSYRKWSYSSHDCKLVYVYLRVECSRLLYRTFDSFIYRCFADILNRLNRTIVPKFNDG